MNARQKVKKLKKEIETLKEDKSIHGNLWLKIDGYQVKQELPEQDLYAYDNRARVYVPLNVYTIIVGSMRAKLHPISPDDRLIIINSEKLDKVVKEVPPYVSERDS